MGHKETGLREFSGPVLTKLTGLFSVCALGKVIVDDKEKKIHVNTKYTHNE